MQNIIKLVVIICMLISCRSAEQIATRKAAKEAVARQKEMVVLQKVRNELPCIPVQPLKQGITQYLPGEKIPCDGGDSVRCPDQQIRVDTLKLLDHAALKAVRDSLDQAEYMWDQMRQQYMSEAQRGDKLQDQLKEQNEITAGWRKCAWYTWIAIALVVGGGIFSKVKGII